MRILHIIASVDPRSGGVIEGVLRQDEAMRDEAVREIATLDPPDAPFLPSIPVRVHALGATPYARLGRSMLARFGYAPRLVPWLRRHAGTYDCVIVDGLWNYAAVGASLALPGGRTPYFVFPHGMMDPWFRTVKPLKHRVKQLSWRLFEGRLLARAAAVFFTSEEEARLAQGQFSGHRYKGVVVGFGASEVAGDPARQRAAFRQALPALGEAPFLLFLSRIHPKKGCDLLVEAFARIAAEAPHLHLVMAGPDPGRWEPALRQLAVEAGCGDRVHWPGMLSGDVKWGAFRAAEAFVLPSHQENFGVVVAEALACGAPALITRKVNIWREVEAGGGGLAGEDTADGVTALLRAFLALTPAQRSDMTTAARRCFKAHFDMKIVSRTLGEQLRLGVSRWAA